MLDQVLEAFGIVPDTDLNLMTADQGLGNLTPAGDLLGKTAAIKANPVGAVGKPPSAGDLLGKTAC